MTNGTSGPIQDAVPVTTFSSWDEFKSGIGRHLFNGERFRRGRYLFRGHSDARWKLQSTFDRMFSRQPKDKRLKIADALFNRFKRALEGVSIPAEARNSDQVLLAMGQHFGLPTRLLDWSESPYIAAFFAFNRTSLWGQVDQWVAIWVLDTENPIWSAQYGVEIVDVPSFGNERIRNQAGKFTLSRTPFDALEDYALAHQDSGQPLVKMLVPASDSTTALADLDAMGIHHAVVYPEIEGSAQMALFRTVMEFDAHLQVETSRPV